MADSLISIDVLDARAAHYLAVMRDARRDWVFGKLAIDCCEGVFNPNGSSSTAHFCRWVEAQNYVGSVLDFGTGTGALGLYAALIHGCHATLVDRNPAAVACASRNAEKNNLADRVSVIKADRAPAGAYDLILYAAPYLSKRAPRQLEYEYGELVHSMYDDSDASKLDLITKARELITADGRLVMQLGSISRLGFIREFANQSGWKISREERAPDDDEEHVLIEFVRSR